MNNEFKGFDGLIQIMKRLRGPDGCPWDKEQTMESLKPYIIEEAYEVVEAIDGGDKIEIKEELGDLLLQVVFLSELADEAGEFNVDGVIDAITEKLVRRHPHVFADEASETTAEVLKSWASIKVDEKKEKGGGSVLEGVPKQMPALLRAHRITEKAARVGFDWDNLGQVFAKLEEEMAEFEEAVKSKEPEKMEDELGDVIFSLVNIARFLEVNPEEALKKTITKFSRRFNHIENCLEKSGVDIREASLDQMEELWNDAKKKEK